VGQVAHQAVHSLEGGGYGDHAQAHGVALEGRGDAGDLGQVLAELLLPEKADGGAGIDQGLGDDQFPHHVDDAVQLLGFHLDHLGGALGGGAALALLLRPEGLGHFFRGADFALEQKFAQLGFLAVLLALDGLFHLLVGDLAHAHQDVLDRPVGLLLLRGQGFLQVGLGDELFRDEGIAQGGLAFLLLGGHQAAQFALADEALGHQYFADFLGLGRGGGAGGGGPGGRLDRQNALPGYPQLFVEGGQSLRGVGFARRPHNPAQVLVRLDFEVPHALDEVVAGGKEYVGDARGIGQMVGEHIFNELVGVEGQVGGVLEVGQPGSAQYGAERPGQGAQGRQVVAFLIQAHQKHLKFLHDGAELGFKPFHRGRVRPGGGQIPGRRHRRGRGRRRGRLLFDFGPKPRGVGLLGHFRLEGRHAGGAEIPLDRQRAGQFGQDGEAVAHLFQDLVRLGRLAPQYGLKPLGQGVDQRGRLVRIRRRDGLGQGFHPAQEPADLHQVGRGGHHQVQADGVYARLNFFQVERHECLGL